MRSALRMAFFLTAPGLTFLGTLYGCVGEDPGAGVASEADASAEASGADGGGGAEGGGGEGGAPDAGGPRCDPQKPFASLEVVKGLSTGDDERAVWVSGDELTAVVVVDGKLRVSKRASRDVDFGAPASDPAFDTLNVGANTSVSLTEDQRSIFVHQAGGGGGAFFAHRASATGAFGPLGTMRTRGAPFGGVDPFVSATADRIFFATPNAGAPGAELSEATRDLDMTYGGDAGLGEYDTAKTLLTVVSDQDDLRPVVDKASLVLVFASARPPATTNARDMYIATRAGVAGDFTPPVRLADPINGTSDDRPGAISADGCALYFTSDRPGGFGQYDVYVATRGK